MKWTDIVVLALIGLLAWRAVLRLRRQGGGCAGGCAGCAQAGRCTLPQKEDRQAG